MKAIIDPHLFTKELKKLSPCISKSTVIPVLECVRLDFKKNQLTLTATDLETIIVLQMNCECAKPFSILIDYASLIDALKYINSPVLIEMLDKGIQLTAEDSTGKLPLGGELTSFPKIPEDDFLFSFEAETDFFSSLYCADQCKNTNEMMERVASACLNFKKDKLVIVGTDGFMMYKKDLKIPTGKKHQSLVSGKLVQAIKELQNGKVSIGEKFVKVEHGTETIISRVKDAKFADYEPIIPSEILYNFEVDRKEFILALNRASTMSSKSTRMGVLNFDKNGIIKITAQDIDFEKEGEASFRASCDVDIAAVGLNCAYMVKLLNLFDSETVKMAFGTSTSPMFIKNSDSEDLLCLLLPMMINN